MKILVTGGAGYLGAVLVPKLLASGHYVDVLDSFRHGVPSLPGGHIRLEIVHGDVRDESILKPLLERADAVVHLAALVGASTCETDRGNAVSTNLWATAKLVEMLRADQPLIFPCTNSGYGKSGAVLVTESDPMTPLSLYGTTKVRAEQSVLRHKLGVSLRLATLYGPSPRMRLDLLVNDFVHRATRPPWNLALYEPLFRRCVLHVSDAAAAIEVALDNPHHVAGRPWNVGAENMTKGALCEMIQQHAIKFSWQIIAGRDPDQRDYAVSSAGFRTATGWEPKINLNTGSIAELIKLYRMPFEGPQWRNA